MAIDTQRERLSTTEAAEFLGLSPQMLRHWRTQRETPIPFTRHGTRTFRYEIGDLKAYLAKVKHTTGGPPSRTTK